MLRVYLDNNVVSRVGKLDDEKNYPKVEIDAVRQLLEWNRTGEVTLGTSRQAPREMERAPVQYQAGLKSGLPGVEMAPDDHIFLGSYTLTDPYGGCISNPLVADIVDESLYPQLLAAGLKEDDAKHLMYAAHNGYDRFVTWDRDFFSRKSELEKLCSHLQIQRPSELVAEQQTAASRRR